MADWVDVLEQTAWIQHPGATDVELPYAGTTDGSNRAIGIKFISGYFVDVTYEFTINAQIAFTGTAATVTLFYYDEEGYPIYDGVEVGEGEVYVDRVFTTSNLRSIEISLEPQSSATGDFSINVFGLQIREVDPDPDPEPEPDYPTEVNDKILGYIFNTGAMSADSTPFQQLVTFDGPTRYSVRDSCIGKQGLYVLSHEQGGGEGYRDYAVHTLPLPGGTTNLSYSDAKKQTYTWKSKKYVMPGRTTWAAAKVVMDKGCVRMRLYVDGCCKYDKVVTTCAPFRLTDQLVGHTLEIELIGQAVIHEVHVASTIEELINGRG